MIIRIKNKKMWMYIGTAIIVIATIVLITVSESIQSSQKASINKNDTSINIESLFDNDATQDKDVNNGLLLRTYSNSQYILYLDNEQYVIMDPESISRFSGHYEYFSGNDVFEHISKFNLKLKCGLNDKKINTNNLFYVKAYYDKHVYSGTEFYHKELNHNKELSFDFLIYFKETNEGEYIVASKLLNNPNISFNNTYF